MSRRFLTPIACPKITIDNAPINPTDGVNKAYIDLRGIPAGGTIGQALVKKSNAHYDVQWQTISGGTSGTPTDIDIDMGTFSQPNGFIDCGTF